MSAKTTVGGVVIKENQVLNPPFVQMAGKIFKLKNLTSVFVCDLLELRKPVGGSDAGAETARIDAFEEINYGKELGL